MSARFRKKEKDEIAELAMAEDLLAYIDKLGLQAVGANKGFLLAEVAGRLDIPTDAVSLVIARGDKQGVNLYHWGNYEENRVAALRAYDGHKWNGTVKANQYILSEEEYADFLAFNNGLFNKTAVIDGGSYRIIEGEAAPEWSGDALYELSDQTYSVNLGDVARKLAQVRPGDEVQRIAVHGNNNSDIRPLFGTGLEADQAMLNDLVIETRHPLLLFRVQVPAGQLRYLFYSAADNELLQVCFGDAKNTRQLLAQFKEAQQRTDHPLVENDEELFEHLHITALPRPE